VPRIIKVTTTSFATLEDFAPPFNLRHPDPQENLERGLSLLEAAGTQGADLALLPEGFMAAGLPGSRLHEVAQPCDGPAFRAVAEQARRHRMNVVAGFYVLEAGRLLNIAALFDRDGRLVGTYAKKHPTEGEIACGVTPGGESRVFETDVGRIGLAICFDINWQPLWSELKAAGAELVCWLSAYEGGLPLRAYACLHQLHITTSVWPYHARIIEPTGRVVAETSRWGRLATAALDIDMRLFHTDGQSQHILPIQTRYGARLKVETFTEEHIFTLSSTDPSLEVDQVIAEYGLVEFNTYLARCTRAQDEAR
jgi:predicted amidohydrolase